MTQPLPSFSKALNGHIWRMEIDEVKNIIYLEVRRAEDKAVSFAAIDLNTASTLFENLSTQERWLTGIEAAFNGVLLLHGYQSQNSPVHKGITAINEVGTELWSNYALTFDHLTINGPVAYASQVQPQRLFLLDVISGSNIRPHNAYIDKQQNNSIVFPELRVASDLNLQLPVLSYNNVLDYIAFNNYIIVSLHTQSGGLFKQHLYVWRRDELVHEDLLNNNIQKMQPEAFILFQNRVIYVRNKAELTVLAL